MVLLLTRYIGLSKRNAVTFLTYYFPIISETLRARKFVQMPFDAAHHALFLRKSLSIILQIFFQCSANEVVPPRYCCWFWLWIHTKNSFIYFSWYSLRNFKNQSYCKISISETVKIWFCQKQKNIQRNSIFFSVKYFDIDMRPHCRTLVQRLSNSLFVSHHIRIYEKCNCLSVILFVLVKIVITKQCTRHLR